MTSRAQDVAIYLSHHFHSVWDEFGFFDLQRLLYLAQGWHLAAGKGLLFRETIGAHRSAPLTGTVKGLVPLDEMLPQPDLPFEDEDFLDSFCTTYGIADRETVKRQVDRDDGAWRLTQSIAGEGGYDPACADAGHLSADVAGSCRIQPPDAAASGPGPGCAG